MSGIEPELLGGQTNEIGREPLTRMLSGIASSLGRDESLNEGLRDLVNGITDLLFLAGAGISLAEGEALRFAVAADERVGTLERLQADTEVGPSIDAYRSGQAVLVADLADHCARWPTICDPAREAGLSAVAGIPMNLGASRFGVLGLYHDTRHDWSEEEIRVATLLADSASGYLAHAHRLDAVRVTADQLQTALDSRVVIEQAKGVLAGERNISVDAAFQVLRTHARSHNASLHSVADAVVNLGLRP